MTTWKAKLVRSILGGASRKKRQRSADADRLEPRIDALRAPGLSEGIHDDRAVVQKRKPSAGSARVPAAGPSMDVEPLSGIPEWVDSGRALQHPARQDESGRPIAVRIGLDFGTAFTKAAVRVGFDLIPVDWSGATGDESPVGRYVMPGLVYRTPAGEYRWKGVANAEACGNLKLSAIENASSGECPSAAVAHLALAIRYARAFVYHHRDVGRRFASRSIRWELNVGCPTKPHENPAVVDLLQRIGRVAWRLAAAESLFEADVLAAWKEDRTDVGLEADPCVVPEFVAQIAGYLRSTQIREGLHALVDVGAGTLDVATFNVVLPQEKEDLPTIPIFFSDIKPLGTHFLSCHRYSRLSVSREWDDAEPVESTDAFAKRFRIAKGRVAEVDTEFVARVSRCIVGVIDTTRTNARGDPRSSAWREGLPVFVTGGGSGCELYRRAIDTGQVELAQRISAAGQFRLIELDPLGGQFLQIGPEVGGRLTVAVGLTEDAESIARIVPHGCIPPISPEVRERRDHTELYGDK